MFEWENKGQNEEQKTSHPLIYADGLNRLIGLVQVYKLIKKPVERDYEVTLTLDAYQITAEDMKLAEAVMNGDEFAKIHFQRAAERNSFLIIAMELMFEDGHYSAKRREMMEKFCECTQAGEDYVRKLEEWIVLRQVCEEKERELRNM